MRQFVSSLSLFLWLTFFSQNIVGSEKPSAYANLLQYLASQTTAIERSDPPFYKIKTPDNQIIYVVGTIHTVHPEVLLPPEPYKIFKNLFDDEKTIIFFEHPLLYDNLLQKLDIQKTPSKQWDILEIIGRYDFYTELWDRLKDVPFQDNERYTVGKIEYLDRASGVFLLYSFTSGRYRATVPGFESSLRSESKNGRNFYFLEGVDEFLTIMDKYPKDLEDFLTTGLSLYDAKKSFVRSNDQERKRKILVHYKESIKNYDHARYIAMGQGIKESTKERNRLWSEKLRSFIRSSKDTFLKGQPPILIICGGAHLAGGAFKSQEGFLNLLFQNNLIAEFFRLSKEGQWQEMSIL